MPDYDAALALVGPLVTVTTDGPWFDVADLVVRKVLTAPTCAEARDGRPCVCGCVALLVRQVQEHFERSCSAAVQVHKADICAPPTGRP